MSDDHEPHSDEELQFEMDPEPEEPPMSLLEQHTEARFKAAQQKGQAKFLDLQTPQDWSMPAAVQAPSDALLRRKPRGKDNGRPLHGITPYLTRQGA